MTIEPTRDEMQSVQDTLRTDAGPRPPAAYQTESTRSFGLEEISIERYISREFHELEMERLWPRVWQWVCCEEDIPKVGDHVVYNIGNTSLIIMRAGPDRIHAFHNSCPHRGSQLKEEPGSCKKITCGFHGWTFNLDGSLVTVPCQWDFPQVEAANHGLVEVRLERWAGFVFVNLDGQASPLLDQLDVLPEHFRDFPLEDKFTVANVSKIVPCNWKTAIEAFFESYHVIATHPQVLEWSGDANSQYDVWRTTSRLYTLFAVPSPHLGRDYDPQAVYQSALGYFVPPGTPSADVPPLPDGADPREAIANVARTSFHAMLGIDLTDKSTAEVIDAVQYFMFPNWMPWGGVVNGIQYRFRPNGDDHDTSILDVRLMLPVPPGGERPPSAPVRHLGIDDLFSAAPELMALGPILDQDLGNMRRLARGLKASVRKGLTFGEYQESRIRHFHQLLDQILTGA